MPENPDALKASSGPAEPSGPGGADTALESSGEKESVLRWRGLKVICSGDETMSVPDLDLKKGQAVLVKHHNERVLHNLGRAASGQAEEPNDILWFGRNRPGPEDFQGTLSFLRQIAYVGPESQLIGNITLLQNMCLELEYNQEADSHESRRRASECLESLGLSPMAELAPAKLAGPARYVSLLALAISRRPKLYVLDRPRCLLTEHLFARVFGALEENAKRYGQAALVLGLREIDYQDIVFDQALILDDSPLDA